MTDLQMALEVNYFKIGKDKFFVPIAVKVPSSQIELKQKGQDEVTEFDFIGQVRDSHNRVVGVVRDGIKVKVRADAKGKRRSFQYSTGFSLPPGSYGLKFLARENQSGKMGTFETKFMVPELSASEKTLQLSSVVLSSQREPLTAAVGGAGVKKKVAELDPLVQDGQRLVPSITRAFRKDQNLLVFLEVYDPALDPQSRTSSLTANVSFFLGGKKAFESPGVRLSRDAKAPRGAVPLQFQIPLEKLPPGQYTCQINIVDEVGRRFAFPRGSLVLTR
jgi:hypothetical protein